VIITTKAREIMMGSTIHIGRNSKVPAVVLNLPVLR